jgi:hypothetical protein
MLQSRISFEDVPQAVVDRIVDPEVSEFWPGGYSLCSGATNRNSSRAQVLTGER